MGVKQDGGTFDTVPAMEQEKISDELDKRVKKFLRGAEANLDGLKDKNLKGQLAVREELYGKSAQAAAKAEKTVKAAMLGEIMDYLKLRLQVKMPSDRQKHIGYKVQ